MSEQNQSINEQDGEKPREEKIDEGKAAGAVSAAHAPEQ